jgi:hypothetical protein
MIPYRPNRLDAVLRCEIKCPVNAFVRLFGILLPNHFLFRQNGFPSGHLILLDLKRGTAEV